MAAGRRRLPRRPHVRRRGLDAGAGAARPVRGAGRLHTAFNFDYLVAPWDPTALREAIDVTTGHLREVGASATWVLSNHDVVRHPSRYGRPAREPEGVPTSAVPAVPTPPPTSRSAPGAPGRPCCSRPRYRAGCTSTRARSSACPRSRTFLTRNVRIRPGSARGTRSAAATAPGAAAVVGRGGRVGGLQPGRGGRAVAPAARRVGALTPRRASRATPTRCSSSTAPSSTAGAPTRRWATAT